MGAFTPIRDRDGGIVGMQETKFAQTLHETMAAVGAAEPEEEHAAPRPSWRPGRLELAGIVGGLVLAAALIAGLNVFLPAPAPRLARPTVAPAPTVAAPTVTIAPTAAPTATPAPPTATLAPPPTPEPEIIYVPVEAPCDTDHPRFVVHIDMPPYGSATGVSCNSQEEAQANAEAYAAQVRAAFAATPTTVAPFQVR